MGEQVMGCRLRITNWVRVWVPKAVSNGSQIIASVSQASLFVGLHKISLLVLLKRWVLLLSEESRTLAMALCLQEVEIGEA